MRLHADTSRCILKETTKSLGVFGTMPQEPWHLGKGAKPDRVIQLNCREVFTHASYKNNQHMRRLQQPRNKNDPPFRQTMISS